MKKNAVITLVELAFVAAQAQGTVNFANVAVGGLNAPVWLCNGTRKASGPDYVAELWAGSSMTNMTHLATTTLLRDAAAGYFTGGPVAVPNVPPGTTAYIAVIVWNSGIFPSLGAAQASDASDSWGEFAYNYSTGTLSPLTVLAGGGGAPPAPLSPLVPCYLAPVLDSQPLIHQTRDVDHGTVILSFTGTLEVSTNLIDWTDVVGFSPQIFPATNARQYFRTSSLFRCPP